MKKEKVVFLEDHQDHRQETKKSLLEKMERAMVLVVAAAVVAQACAKLASLFLRGQKSIIRTLPFYRSV